MKEEEDAEENKCGVKFCVVKEGEEEIREGEGKAGRGKRGNGQIEMMQMNEHANTTGRGLPLPFPSLSQSATGKQHARQVSALTRTHLFK